MADQGEVYLDYSRPGGAAKKGKRKRKNKKNRNNGESSFAQEPAANEVADEEYSGNRNAADEQETDVAVPRPESLNKESEIPEADRAELKESETPEAERVEELSPTESVSFADYADETEDKENADVVDNMAANIADMDNFVNDIEEMGIEATEMEEEDEPWMSQQEEEVEDVIEDQEEEEESEEIPMLEEDGNQEQDVANEEEEEEDVDIPMTIDEEGRVELYEKAVSILKQGKKETALKCFLRCLTGLKDNAGFRFLPQCLHQIADIYYEKEELDKAIQFIQAEKMYYETALISTSHKQKLVEEKRRSLDGESEDKENVKTNPELLRADEYENLAKLCLDKNQPQYALEYQGKATKIRQQIYGQNHPVTASSLDNFALIYAEVGKKLYSESMHKMAEDSSMPEEMLNQIEVEPASELRNRKKNEAAQEKEMIEKREKSSEEESPVTQAEETDSLEVQPQNEGISGTLLWILFFIFTLVLSVIVFYIYCRWDVSSKSCIAWKSDLHYYYKRAQYLYHSTFFPDAKAKSP